MKEFSDRFGVFGKVEGMDEDYSEKILVYGEKILLIFKTTFYHKNWISQNRYFLIFEIFGYVLGDIKCQLLPLREVGTKFF